MANPTLTVTWAPPRWWREYVGFLIFIQTLGFEVDTDHAASFLARHGKFKCKS
jgi:hypothetical protein